MKLVVTGSTGYVATELIRQCLSNSKVTSVIALGRRPVSAPEDIGSSGDASKLKNVILEDFEKWTDDVRKQLEGVDACIWCLAITPAKSGSVDHAFLQKVNHDYTMIGLEEMFKARGKTEAPFRFLYMSGHTAERDQTKRPWIMPDHSLMRGETENQVLAFAEEHKGQVEACCAKPGPILSDGQYARKALSTLLKYVVGVPSVKLKEIAAAMLHETLNGFSKEPLSNDDLVKVGSQILQQARAVKA